MFFFLCVPIGLYDLVEMGTHRALGPVGIARGDGFIDRLMRPAGDEFLPRRTQGDGPLLGQPGRNGLMDRGEDRVARDHCQHVVERDIGPLEGIEIVERLTIGLERALEGVDVVGGRMLRGIARQTDLEERTRFLEVAHPIRRSQQVPRRAGQRFEDDLGRGLGDARTLAAVDGDEPHLLQCEERLAHRRAADAELLHEIALGRQLVADRISALLDHRLEAARDLFIEPAATDGAWLVWYTYHTSRTLGQPAAHGQDRCESIGLRRSCIQ